MNPLLIILAVVLVGSALLRWAIKRKVLHLALEQGVGQKAMAKLSDTIHLTPKTGHQWSNPKLFTSLTEPLRALGFSDAGVYEIPEMAGTVIAFYVHLSDRVACAIYDHPKVGVWLNFYSHYKDGRRVTVTTRPPSGLDPMPGATTIYAPGAATSALYERFLRERPKGDLEDMTPMNVVARFEAAYVSEMAWRKQKGVSAEELARQIDKRQVKFSFSIKQK